MSRFAVTFLISAVVTGIATPIAIFIAPRIGAMDIPKDDRRMHDRAVPILGGPAIYLGVLAILFIPGQWREQIFGIVLASGLIMLVGLRDDIRPIKASTKLLWQILCAVILFYFSIRIQGMANIFPIGPAYIRFPMWLSVIFTVAWVVGITNTINLIDGLDGLAAGITCIACFSVAYTFIMQNKADSACVVLAVAGSCFGFLLYNFHPAKIFMGDSGSMMLGFLLASLSLVGDSPSKSTTLFATFIPMAILALPIFDTAFAIVRRIISGRPVMEGDKGHLHHRIMAMGFGQVRTVLALYCISAIMGIAGVLWTADVYLEASLLALIAFTLVFIFLDIGNPVRSAEGTAEVDEDYGN